jgi:hypothetical protein
VAVFFYAPNHGAGSLLLVGINPFSIEKSSAWTQNKSLVADFSQVRVRYP